MKFGLMYEIQIPEPYGPTTEQDQYNQVLAQVDLADEVGFDYFWTVEHCNNSPAAPLTTHHPKL